MYKIGHRCYQNDENGVDHVGPPGVDVFVRTSHKNALNYAGEVASDEADTVGACDHKINYLHCGNQKDVAPVVRAGAPCHLLEGTQGFSFVGDVEHDY